MAARHRGADVSQAGRLYGIGSLKPAGTTSIETMPTRLAVGQRHHLAPTLKLWNEPNRRAIRQQVNAAFTVGSTAFLDPVDAFGYWDGDGNRRACPRGFPSLHWAA